MLGLERFDLVHEYGSSHGLTRIIRLAYWEHPTYVSLLRPAYELWRELEDAAGERLLHITGSVDAGPAGGPVFEGALRSSELHGLPHEVMDGAELHRRFPGYRLRSGSTVIVVKWWIPTPRPEPQPEDEELLRAFARRYFPDGAGPTMMLKACLFTNSPDRHFILDRHPDHPEVAIAAGFSGHGYKFCSVIGEIMADLARDGQTRHDIELFRLKRFTAAP